MSEAPPSTSEVIDLTALSDSDSDIEGRPAGRQYEDDNDSEAGSEDSAIEITLDEETRAQLLTAIATVSETRLRQIMRELIEIDITIEAALTKELVTVKRGTQNIVPRWETCAVCDDEYDTNTLRENTECIFHPGELEVDQEMFADWDEDCHGPMDSSETRREYPENFAWTCCNDDGNSAGCARGEHRPAVSTSRKRRRVY
ncbi:hypothetical protein CPB83DRAFT_631578 [Crepidotus variabilis]|uniref:C2H2-type domain-containing protein n=1 Tax=Crepidotus variabilis TaxID=179855 RepID=A0A9P6EQ37_9AGAR|nr:hypothetical protein CPB83DRAFT_631578 [Crepidotus variabilis]